MTSYGERVRWLVQELAAGNGRELARMAGLKNSGHVNTFLSRYAVKPSAKLDPDTIERFVEHLGVDRKWLMSGEGSPLVGRHVQREPDPTPTDDEIEVADPLALGRWRDFAARYATFRAHATLAHRRGVDDAVLDSAADRLGFHKGDGPTDEEVIAAIQSFVREFAMPLDGRDATAEDFATPATTSAARPRPKKAKR